MMDDKRGSIDPSTGQIQCLRAVFGCEPLTVSSPWRVTTVWHKELTHVSDPRDRFYYGPGAGALPGLRAGMDLLEAGLHHRCRAEAQAPLHPRPRHRRAAA